ncbi:DUF927 domain-containing protein [Roseomonas sp. NAR14]|uniref:DUF927 domain-containing protein n=1 Tax=Roseomonas acroporae TaxID=2937791 RepID=A0A9X1YKN0_9PROT|nr:DUF927 domain-containing protein [Roseomonas acroporae]MCK8787741.1 DUF927 domain-containing protein [Roseomonas acroporae]
MPDPRFAPLGEPGPAGPASAPPPPERPADAWAPILPAPLPLPKALRHRDHGVPSTVWRYLAADGALLFAVARFDTPAGKQVLPYCGGAGGWRWRAAPVPRPLYGLDRLAARLDAPVLVVEGEKTADAAAALFPDHAVLTWPGGCKAVLRADWTPLADRVVVIWPDHDEPGRKAAAAIAQAAGLAGAERVAVVTVPAEWPDGWDLADPPPAGTTVETLHTLVMAAVPVGGDDAADDADPDAEPDADPAADPHSPEQMQAEVARLAGLSGLDYQATRKAAAQALGIGVGALDKAVRVEQARRRAAAAEADRSRPPPGPGEVRWPFGFLMRDDGLHADTGGDDGLVWLAAPFEVLGEARDAAGEGWSLWLRWRDRDGRPHTWPMPHRLLMVGPGELEAALVERGLRVSPDLAARQLLRRALGEVQSGSRVMLVTRAGWHGGVGEATAYVLPDGTVIGEAAEALALRNTAEDAARRVATAGTLTAWQEQVAALAVGNPVATFCLAAAFVGPLLEIAGEDGGGVHLFGPSKRGKTVALKMASSVWGPPDKAGALRDWRATSNALEAACEEAADGLLTLDEIQQAEARGVEDSIYVMGNGGGKGRLRADTTARKRRTWRTFFLSNGEIDVATVAQKAGRRVPPGAEVRLPSVPLPADLWPDLHGRPDFQALCADLATAAIRQHGTAGRAFLAQLTRIRAEEADTLPTIITERRAAFLGAHVPAGADPQVREVARRMALVAAAGEIAAKLGVLPWPSEVATAAAATVLGLWRGRRGGDGSGEEAAHLAKVRLFLVQHGASRLQLLWLNQTTKELEEVLDPARPVVNRAGWRRRQPDGSDLYLIHPETWRAEVCEGLDATEVARTLLAAGHLEPGEGNRLGRKVAIPGFGKIRVYAVKATLMTPPEPEEKAA